MTVIQKEQIKQTWKSEQMHEMFAHISANNMMAAMTVLGKHGGETAVEEFKTATRTTMVEYLKKQGVKTPIEIVKAKAEIETNIYGSVIEVSGDDKEAHLTYIKCGMWDAMNKSCGSTCSESKEKMMKSWENCVSAFAKEFGYTGEVKMNGEQATIIIKK